jgi:hypothetical protein
VDAYLALAQNILRQERRPLTAREILKEAYRRGQVPQHLHGRTQHKTLGARLSEDVLKRKDRSLFFRSAPGRFFLTELLDDQSIASEHRTRFVARRRRRQLAYKKALAVKAGDLNVRGDQIVAAHDVFDLFDKKQFHYAPSSKEAEPDDVLVWSFVMVSRGTKALTYRHGAFREDRDSFRHRRALGFYAPVTETDRTLFDLLDHGIVSSGIRNVTLDLGLSSIELASHNGPLAQLEGFVRAPDDEPHGTLLSVVRFHAPDWFEPYTRRLAINDLEWLDLPSINHIDDFDPWSRAVLNASYSPISLEAAHGA